jgi:hypothetical protein
MSETTGSDPRPEMTRDEMVTALFAHLVMQQTNMALMLMGKVPHPQSGQAVKDLEAARLFIDQLEMLEAKTKGNLSPEEAGLLKQSLMSARLAFVEAVEAPAPSSPPGPAEAKPEAAPGAAPAAPAEEHQKKFTKKY